MKSAYHRANYNFKNFPPFFFSSHTHPSLICALVIREGVVNSCSERPFCYTTPLTFMRSCVDLSSNPSIHLPSFPLIWPLVILEGVADRCPGAMWTPYSWQTYFFHHKKNIYIYTYILYNCSLCCQGQSLIQIFICQQTTHTPGFDMKRTSVPVHCAFYWKGPCLKRARLTCRRNADVSIA